MKPLNLSITEHAGRDSSVLSAGQIIIGTVVKIDSHGRILVDFTENPGSEPLVAISTLALTAQHVDRKVALLFNQGDLNQPVVMGLIHNPLDHILDNVELMPTSDEVTEEPAGRSDNLQVDAENQVLVDGKKVSIEGAEEVTLKCGKASITLTKSGKILIRGTYLLNRSSGVNKILGGAVQIN